MKYCCYLLSLALSLNLAADDITPLVGNIEIYGIRKVSAQKIRSAIKAKPGDPLPSREDVEEKIDKIPGVLASRVEAECCAGRSMILYVGVQERDEPHFEFHPAPNGAAVLPAGLVDKYRAFLDSVSGSLRGGNADEDLTNGFSLLADPGSRDLQLEFKEAVAQNLTLVDQVVRESEDPEQRTAAAYLLQYAPRDARSAKVMVDGLQYALQDQEDSVRQNAMRSLRAVIVGAKLHPEQQIRVAATWFVELLNSVVWSDRHDAAQALVDLTDKGDPEALSLIRERALQSVVEMAKWQHLRHALPAFMLAGRVAGLDDKQISDAWVSGDRALVLAEAQNLTRRKSHLLPKKSD